MRIAKIALSLAVLCIAAKGFASDVIEDAIKLTTSGINEEVIVAWAGKQHSLDVTVKNIVALKDGKVSDKVILALIKSAEAAPAAGQRWIGRDGQVESAPRENQAPATRYEPTYDNNRAVAPYVPSTAYVSPSVSYVDYTYGYPYYSYASYGYPYYASYGYPSYCGYPYYGYYPGVSFNFGFGGHFHGGGFHGGGFHGGGFHGGGFNGGGGFRGGVGFSSGVGFRGHR